MGGYDLYGNYYPQERDAINAEMAQCASIDSGIQQRENQETKAQITSILARLKRIEQILNVAKKELNP